MENPNGSTAVILDSPTAWLVQNNEAFRKSIEERLLELLFDRK